MEDKRRKVKKGYLTVSVGLDNGEDENTTFERFVVPISYLHHPFFNKLLEKAQEIYGFGSCDGPIKLPCSVDEFLRVQRLIENDFPCRRSKPCSSKGRGGAALISP